MDMKKIANAIRSKKRYTIEEDKQMYEEFKRHLIENERQEKQWERKEKIKKLNW